MNNAAIMNKTIRFLASFILGCSIGLLLHYTLYRMGLPVAPFVYMAF